MEAVVVEQGFVHAEGQGEQAHSDRASAWAFQSNKSCSKNVSGRANCQNSQSRGAETCKTGAALIQPLQFSVVISMRFVHDLYMLCTSLLVSRMHGSSIRVPHLSHALHGLLEFLYASTLPRLTFAGVA